MTKLCTKSFHKIQGIHIENYQEAVWKIQYFCTTQILREINFGDCRSAKTAVFAILRAVKIVHIINFSLKK